MRRAAAVVALAVAVGAAAWLLASRRGDVAAVDVARPVVGGDAPPALAASDVPSASPSAEARPPPPPDEGGGAAPAAPARLVGSVRFGDGGRIRGGTLYVSGKVGNADSEVARTDLPEDGEFALSVPFRGGEGPWLLHAIAVVPGRPRLDAHVEARPGEIVRVELAPSGSGGKTLVGRVVADGRGVPDLRFALAKSPQLLVVGLEDRFAVDTDWQIDAVAVTDADGAFDFRGLRSVSGFPVSLDPEWSLEWGEGGMPLPGSTEVRQDIVATAAFALEGVVLDAATRRPIEHSNQTFDTVGGSSESCGGCPPRFWFREAVPGGGRDAFVVNVSVDAEGYRAFDTSVTFAAGERRRRLDVLLQPLAEHETGTLWLESGIRDEAGKDVPIWVIRQVARGRNLMGTPLTVGPAREGAFPVRLPEGVSTLLVTPQSPFGALIQWRGEVRVVAGREDRLAIPWGPYGALAIAAKAPAENASAMIEVRSTAERRSASYSWGGSSRRVFVPALPVGSWTVERLSPAPLSTKKVVVDRDTTTIVELGD